MNETSPPNATTLNDKMESWFYSIPYQLKHTLELKIFGNGIKKNFQNLFLCGMGGSAIGGELLLEGLQGRITVPTRIIRDTTLPIEANEHSAVVLVSYSGNTHETLSLFEIAKSRNATIAILTSGGKLLELAQSENLLHLELPKDYMPRAAIGYLFAGIWRLLYTLQIAPSPNDILLETSETLCGVMEGFRNNGQLNDTNSLKEIVQYFSNKVIWIWSSANLSSVARRWANQFAENSKHLAHWNLLPEVYHNELVGLCDSLESQQIIVPVFLIEEEDKMFLIAKDLLRESGYHPLVFKRKTRDISGLLYLVVLGDFLSIELAKLKGILPTPIPSIEKLKSKLAN